MMRRSRRGERCGSWLGVLGVGVLALAVFSCGPKEEPPGPDTPAPEETAKALPPAVRVLQYTPAEASIGAVILSPPRLIEKGVATAKRFVTDEADVDTMTAEWTASLMAALELPEATSYEEAAAAAGIDAEAPVGVFLKVEPKAPSETQAAPSPKPAGEADESAEAAASIKPEESAETDSEPGEASDEELNDMLKDLEDHYETAAPQKEALAEIETDTAVALLFECSDIERTKAYLNQGGASAEDGGATEEPEFRDGVTVVHRPDGDRYYLANGSRMVVGDDLDLVKGVAGRFDEPVEVRYATSDCPADEADEVAALVNVDTLLPMLVGLTETAAPLGESAQGGKSPAAAGLLSAYAGDDPLVFTLALDEHRVELLARIDGATHPQLAAMKGAVIPLAQAQLFPKNVLALLSLAFTPESKQALQKTIVSFVPEAARNTPSMAQGVGTVQLVLASIGEEISLAVAPSAAEGGLPTILGLVDLVNTDQTKAFLQTLGLPMELKETYAGAEIMAAPIPLPVQPPQSAYFAFPQNAMVLGNDLEDLKNILDRLSGGGPSALFSTLEPPLDPAAPREALFLVQAEVLSKIVVPLLKIQGLVEPATQEMLARTEAVVQDLRYEKDVVGTWYRDKVTLRMKAALASGAGPTTEETGPPE